MPIQLLRSILLVLAIGLPVWALFRLFMARRSKPALGRELMLGLFVAYLLAIFAITVVPMPWTSDPRPVLNLVPVIGLIDGLMHSGSNAFGPRIENFFGNIILFVPFGAFLAILWKRFLSAGQVIWVAAASSASIEISQYLAQFIGSYRTSDVDDVILNTVGAFLGMLAVRAFVHLRNAKAGSAIWQE